MSAYSRHTGTDESGERIWRATASEGEMSTKSAVNILLVDDERANLLALDAILGNSGWNLVAAQSGEEALAAAEEKDFAVILLDVQMTGIDGYETARQLRSRPRSRVSPIIFLTAFDTDLSSQSRAYELGAVDFLVKPLKSSILKAKVQVFVELHQKTERVKELEREQFRQQLTEERRRWEETAYLVSRTFAEGRSEDEALRTVLQTVCEQLNWDAAGLWMLADNALVLKVFWQVPDHPFPKLEAASRSLTLSKGLGLLGRVWSTCGPVWVHDFSQESKFPRLAAANSDGARAAVGFPILVGPVFLGVVELFSRSTANEDASLITVLADIGTQIGPFLQRMQGERALVESEARKAAMLNAALDCVITIDDEDRVLEWNPAAETTFGYSRDDALGKSIAELIIPVAHREAHYHGMARYLATGHGPVLGKVVELPAQRADGSEFQAELVICPIRTGTDTLFTAYLRDISGRKRSELAVQESEGRLQLAVEIAQMGTFEIDLLTDAVTVNDSGRKIYGWPSRETTFSAVQAHFHPDDRDMVMQEVQKALNPASGATFDVEQRIYRTSGEMRWIRVRGRGQFEGDGGAVRPVKCVGTYLDVTERKLTEESLREAAQRKDEFIALLAHELRNPLAPLRNGLEVMRFAESDQQLVRESRQMMERQLSHMVRLIDDLLDVSRLSRNRLDLRRARVLLSDVINAAIETSRPGIEQARHDFRASIPPEPLYLDADITRLAQVFGNLLTNSAKYTQPDGHIRLTAERHGESIQVVVEDDGIGIPAESLAGIFEMFSQVDRSIERTSGGLGIGLALVKGLVEMHGGEITARSEGAGKGSTFTVVLPLASESIEKPADPAGPSPTDQSPLSRRILVVDDNQDSAKSLAKMLSLLGHEVETAHDGIEALEVAERFHAEIILMDLGMPRLNGYDATRQIREHPWGRDIYIIALTGWGQESDRRRSRSAGCDAHLVKPVEFTQLRKTMDELASNRGGSPNRATT